MNLPLLALFTRSLREDARGQATYWARAGLGGFILLVLFGIQVTNLWTGAPGRNFFITTVTLQAIAITFVGLSYFASAVTEEKEEQTLGLLRMTNLSPLSILLGKSTSRLGGALLLLAAQFPFTIFAVTLGGVSLGQIVATYCTLGAYTFLLCNVALLGSVLARRTPGAAAFSVIVIGLLFSAGPLLGSLHLKLLSYAKPFGLDRMAEVLWKSTPIARLIEVLGTGFAGSPAGWQVASNLALGAVCFLLAWAAFERFCDRAPEATASLADAAQPVLFLRSHRPPRPWHPALAWKDYHFLHGGTIGMKIRSWGYGGALAIAVWHSLVDGPASASTIVHILPFVFSIDSAAMAARTFRSELNDQTFSALAGLPASLRQIAAVKVRALLFMALPGAMATLGVGLLQFASLSGSNGGMELSAMVLTHTISGWVGMVLLMQVVVWLSLSMKRGALPFGYVATHALQILISVLCMMLAALVGYGRSSGIFFTVALSPILSCAASVVGIFVLYRLTLRRLEALAGEG